MVPAQQPQIPPYPSVGQELLSTEQGPSLAHVKGFEQPSKLYLTVIDAAVCHPKANFNFTTGQRGFGKAHTEVDSIFKGQNAPSLEDFKQGLSCFIILFP